MLSLSSAHQIKHEGIKNSKIEINKSTLYRIIAFYRILAGCVLLSNPWVLEGKMAKFKFQMQPEKEESGSDSKGRKCKW